MSWSTLLVSSSFLEKKSKETNGRLPQSSAILWKSFRPSSAASSLLKSAWRGYIAKKIFSADHFLDLFCACRISLWRCGGLYILIRRGLGGRLNGIYPMMCNIEVKVVILLFFEIRIWVILWVRGKLFQSSQRNCIILLYATAHDEACYTK